MNARVWFHKYDEAWRTMGAPAPVYGELILWNVLRQTGRRYTVRLDWRIYYIYDMSHYEGLLSRLRHQTHIELGLPQMLASLPTTPVVHMSP